MAGRAVTKGRDIGRHRLRPKIDFSVVKIRFLGSAMSPNENVQEKEFSNPPTTRERSERSMVQLEGKQ